MLVGYHIQNSPNDYLDAVRELAPGSLVKYTSGWERVIEAKAHNPGVKTWARHVVEQPMPTSNYEQTARNYFQGMVDVNAEHWKFMDYIQGWNEFYAESQHWDEKQHWVAMDIAFAKVWAEEYRPIFPNIRFIMSEAAIGNNIPWQVAEASLEYDALLGYHGYTPMLHKQDHPLNQWPDYAGRWETMDDVFRSKGLLVDWIEGEMGPYQSAITGWRHSVVLDRDMNAYKKHLLSWINHVRSTLAYQQGRFYGGVLFTCGAPGSGPNWSWFDHNTAEMKEIAIFVREVMNNDVPDPPIEPPNSSVKEQLWDESIRLQTVSLNKDAALQASIAADEFNVVESEFRMTIDGVSYAAQAAEHLTRGSRRVYMAKVPEWDDVSWFIDPKKPEVGVIIDVSHWQGTMDWQKAKSAGVTHAHIKATDGRSFVDFEFKANWEGAKKAEILRGAWHYWRNGVEPEVQAAGFLEQLKGDFGELSTALDIEDTDGYPKAENLLRWLEIIEDETGTRPMIYTAEWYWDDYVKNAQDWASNYDLWVAHYEVDAPDLPSDWNSYKMWQYTSKGDGRLYGASAIHIDLNVLARS